MRITPLLLLWLIPTRYCLGATPPTFEPNLGQFFPEIRYVTGNGPVMAAITGDGLIFRRGSDQFRVRFGGAGPLHCRPASPISSVSNYLALEPAIINVPHYSTVTCPELYPGIDWLLHPNESSLELDWTVAPHRAVSSINIHVEHARVVRLSAEGEVQIASAAFSVKWKKPVAYQEIAGTRKYVPISYALAGTHITLQAGVFDRSRPLTIDPMLDFVRVFAGNGDDRGCAIGVDRAGYVYIAGLTKSTDFQTTPGAALPSPAPVTSGAAYQVFVRKLSPDGSKLVYSTYLGLGLLTSHSLGMRVDGDGNVYLATNVFTASLPVAGTPIELNGSVAVYKLTPAGDRLVYATKVLPNFNYNEPVALAVDATGSAYVAAGSFRIGVSKIDSSGKSQLFVYTAPASGYYGGVGNIAVGGDGSVYVAGTTASGGLVTTPGAWKSTIANPQSFHGYLIRLKPDGSGPMFSTYVGGNYIDYAYDVTVDSSGNAYVAGNTYSGPGFPGLSGTPLGVSKPPASGGFIVKVKADGSGPLWTGLLPWRSVNAIALDGAGNLFAASQFDTGVTIAKLNPLRSELVYYSTVTADVRTSTGASDLGLSIDAAGSAYLAASSITLDVPELRSIVGLLPNAWFVKVNPNPPQCDLAISVRAVPATVVPGQTIAYTVTVTNNGVAVAEDVVLSASWSVYGSLLSCRTTGAGACSGGRASFPSIAPGKSENIEFRLQTTAVGANGDQFPIQVSSWTLTSDINQDNNAGSAVSVFDSVTLSITSSMRPSFRVNGSSQLFVASGYPIFFAPNSQVTIEWPTPQSAPFYGPVVFQRWSDGSTANPRTFSLGTSNVSVSATFQRLTTPFVSPGGVTSAASYTGGGVSPGEIITVFGFNLGGPLTTAQVSNGQLVTQLGGTKVLFDGIAAPLVYTSANAAAAIVPYETAGKSSTTMVVQFNNATSTPVDIPVVDAAPGLFTANASGAGQAAALNQDGGTNSPSNPARAGEVIVLYGTGEGLVDPLPPNGTVAGWPVPLPVLPITLTIGGKPARVLYSGGAPALTAGVIQINAEVPSDLPPNHHTPVVWRAGQKSSSVGVTIAID